MEKIYLVYVEKNDYVERVVPCVSMEVAKRVLKGEKLNIISSWASMGMNTDIRKNDDEHFRIVEKFSDASYELSIEVCDIIE